MTVQAAGVGTTMAATVLGVSAQSDGGLSASAVRDQLAVTGVGHLEILVVIALFLVLAGALLIGLVRRHGGNLGPPG